MKKAGLFIFSILFLIIVVQTAKAGLFWGLAWSEDMGWINFGDVSKHWTLVDDDPSSDKGATQVWSETTYEARDAYNIQDPPGGMTETINNISIYGVYKGKMSVGYRLYDNESWPFYFIDSFETWSAIEYSPMVPVRPGGGEWSWDDVKDLQILVDLRKSALWGGINGRLSQVYAKVNYGSDQTLVLRPDGPGDYANIANPPLTVDIEGEYVDPEGADWYDSDWGFRKKITIKNTNVDSDLSDFPLYVNIDSDLGIGLSAKPNGDDIRFTAGDGTTRLSYEKEYFSVSDSKATGHFWVKVPVIKSFENTDIYVYYGNPLASDGSDDYDVWSADYEGVWHMNESSWNGILGEVKDSALNSNDGTRTGDATTTSNGKIYRGGVFDGNWDYVDCGNDASLNVGAGNFSISFWFKTNGGQILYARPVGKGVWNYGYGIEFIYGKLLFWLNGNNCYRYTASDNLNDDEWHHVVAFFDGVGHFYIDGKIDDGTSVTYFCSNNKSTSYDFEMGRENTYYFKGILDELRMSSDVRTAAEIKFEYHNMQESDNELVWGNREVFDISCGVKLNDATCLLSGYAWCDNIGWISFNKRHLYECPSGSCEARADIFDHTVFGWAKPMIFESKKYEYNEESGSSFEYIRGSKWKAQTFTVGTVGDNEDFIIKSVKVLGYRYGSSPGEVIASIKNIDCCGAPVGPDLCSGSIDGNTFTSSGNGEWYEIELSGSNCNLSASTQYALVMRNPGGNSMNYVNWIFVYSPDYLGGQRYSSFDSGGSWTPGTWGTDFNFQVIGFSSDVNDSWIKLSDVSYGVTINPSSDPKELEDWALGQGGVSTGWVSFNENNCDSNGDGIVDISHPGCSSMGQPVPGHKVFVDYDTSPRAYVSCQDCHGQELVECKVYQDEELCLINESLDPDGQEDIIKSEWFTRLFSEPDTSYVLQSSCVTDPILCDFQVPTSILTPSDWHRAKLVIEDSGGLFSEVVQDFYIIKDIFADFECSLDGIVFSPCQDVVPSAGENVYFQDISEKSEYASSIVSREWDWEGTIFGDGAESPSLLADLPTMEVTLTVRDNIGREDSVTRRILGYMPLPSWEEIKPF